MAKIVYKNYERKLRKGVQSYNFCQEGKSKAVEPIAKLQLGSAHLPHLAQTNYTSCWHALLDIT